MNPRILFVCVVCVAAAFADPCWERVRAFKEKDWHRFVIDLQLRFVGAADRLIEAAASHAEELWTAASKCRLGVWIDDLLSKIFGINGPLGCINFFIKKAFPCAKWVANIPPYADL